MRRVRPLDQGNATMARLPGFDPPPAVAVAATAPSAIAPEVGLPDDTSLDDRSLDDEPESGRSDARDAVDLSDDVDWSDEDELLPDAPPATPFTVEVVRSRKRTRTVGAAMVDGVLRITVPSWMSREEEARWVDEMSRRYLRRSTAAGIDLMQRAVSLARRHHLPTPRTVRWVDMRTRWGSCTPAHGTIRIDRRVGSFPPWVLDYVLVHELAHLEVLDHGPEFWKLVARYDRSERAIGYLLAKSEIS